jgi:hypothetical protein
MKKIFKWLGITVAVLLILLISLPFLFKDKIVAKVKEETNKNINAKVDFGDFDLSMIRNFPNFSLRVNNLSVINIAPFEGDTLIYAKQLDVTIDLMSVIKGQTISINSIQVDSPVMYFLVNEAGKANWDIAKPSTEPSGNTEPSKFKASLKKYSISNGLIVYNDKTMPFFLKLENVDHTGTGDFTQDLFVLSTKTSVEKGDMAYGGVKYISKAQTTIDADLEMDMKNMRFTFKDNKIQLNELFLGFSGWVMMPDTNIDMDLKFSAAKSDFKNFISMIPAVYSSEFKNLKSSGTMALDGTIKGRYNSKSMPGFGLNLKIENGMFQYPSLPSSVNNVNVTLAISNPDGIPDHTIINLSKMHVEVNRDPFDARLYLSTPVSDPNIDAFAKGKIDLGGIQKLVPLEKGTTLSGLITADLTMKGRMSAIQQKKFDQFAASGNFGITNMNYNASTMKDPLSISTMNLSFNPAKVTLESFAARVGKSDFNATGSIENFLAYALKNETIVGTVNFNSNLIDLNQFMSGETTAAGTTDTSKMAILDVPGNVNFTLNAKIGKLLYQDLSILNTSGKLEIKDKAISMQDVFMQLMGGSMKMSGKYSSAVPSKPTFNFGLNITNFDIAQTAKSFVTVTKLAPIIKNCSGSYSTNMTVQGDLDSKMSPVMNSLAGSGKLTTSTVVVDNFPAFVKIADALKLSSWKRLSIPSVSPSFKFVNGRVYVDPFDVTINGIKSTVAGSNGFDQTIDYTMATQVPTAMMGSAANSLISGLLSKANSSGANLSVGDVIPINVTITGTVDAPKIGTDLGKAGSKAMDDLKAKANEEFNKKKAEAEAKAREEADKLKKQAEEKFNAEKQRAAAEADRIKKEAEAKAKAYSDSLKKAAEQKAKDQLKGLNPFKK